MTAPTTVVLFGATGDLAKRKLIPGLLHLFQSGLVDDLRVVGTKVFFRPLIEEEIRAYVATGEPMDKAGAYAIQGGARGFVERYEGSYENIVGFPTQEFAKMYEGFEGLLK